MPAEPPHDSFITRDPVTGCCYFLYPNVRLGNNARVYHHAILGFPRAGRKSGSWNFRSGTTPSFAPSRPSMAATSSATTSRPATA